MVQVGQGLASGKRQDAVIDLAGKQHRKHIDDSLGSFGQQHLQSIQCTPVTAVQVIQSAMQTLEGIIVGRQHQHIIGDLPADLFQRLQPVMQRVGPGSVASTETFEEMRGKT